MAAEDDLPGVRRAERPGRPGAPPGPGPHRRHLPRPSLALAESRAHRELPTWLYHFTWGSAAHCIEIPFTFDLLNAERVTAATGPQPPQSLAEAMHGAWVAFIRDLAPGHSGPRCTNRRRTTMTWDVVPEALDDPLSAEGGAWTTP
ncbi:hypothetical protein [Streptomyces sp. NPDC001642]|uniref:hypothetical protein n=1 Tax=Streptomyces sp. NPDC001642 TaxID=3154392 RepID=UPI0033265A11